MSVFSSPTMIQRVASLCSSIYLKVLHLVRSSKNYIVSKAEGYVEGKLDEMKKRSALIVGFEFERFSFDSMEVLFEIFVYNPFLFSVPASQASFKIISNASEILSGTLKEGVWLKAGEESMLLVLVKVPSSTVMKLANDIFGDEGIHYTFDFNLTIQLPIIGNVPLPLPCTQGEFKMDDLFSMLLDKIEQ